ncbi:hypothetical protein C8R46DRAFT_861735, partial [Mycena filopes]
PVLSIPPEITAEIFLRCLPPASVESDADRLGPHARRAPLSLLRVCRTWREIALSIPPLWNSLHFTGSIVEGISSLNTMTQVVTEWFGRAGSSPLTLSLEISEKQKELG